MSAHTDPTEFKRFHKLLMESAPEGYQPFYFPLEKNGKDPWKGASWKKNRKTYGEAYNLMKKGFNIGIAATDQDPLVIVDIDDLRQVKDPKPTLMNQSRKRIGRHCFYFTDDPIARDIKDENGNVVVPAIFQNSAKQNIATEDAGEVRAAWQYVVAAGSYVPCAPEELERIPEDDRPNAGRYSVMVEHSVTKISYKELPEAYRICIENKRATEVANWHKKANRPVVREKDSKNRSALWNLKITDITEYSDNPTKRFPSPFHGSHTEANTSVSNGMLHCWRHNVSHSALTYIAVEAGVSNCSGAGFGHNGAGGSDVDFDDPKTVYTVWLHAKQQGYIPDDDPMPTKAMVYYALQEGMCEEHEIVDGWKLPRDVYNKIIEKAPFNVGREPLKKKSEKIGKSLQQAMLDPMQIAEALQEDVPIYYDPFKNYWMWDVDNRCYNRIDETEIMCQIAEAMDLTIYRSKTKSEILEAIRITGRRRRVKETPKTWIHFRDQVVDMQTGERFEPTPEWFFAAPIPHKYGESEDTPTIDALFDSWVGDRKDLLYEICAYCMLDDYPIHRIFALVGKGRNGKSVYMELIRRLVGRENCVSTDLDRLTRTQFESSKLFKKKAAFIAETNHSTLTRTNILKALSGGDEVPCEFKGKDSFDFINYATIIMATNSLPSTTDRTDGFYSRWLIVPFANQFKEGKNPLENIPEEEYENMCRKCVRILKDVLDRGTFSHEGTIEERREKYENMSNPVQAFINEACTADLDGVVPVWYLYERFDEYREKRGHRKISKDEFSKTLKDMGFELGLKSYNSDRQKIFSDDVLEGTQKKWRSVFGVTFKKKSNGNSSNTGNTGLDSFSYIYNQHYPPVTPVTPVTIKENIESNEGEKGENIEEITPLQLMDRLIVQEVKKEYPNMVVPDEYEFERCFCGKHPYFTGSMVKARLKELKMRGWKV